eukprot:1015969-Rhodomonas_salina.1
MYSTRHACLTRFAGPCCSTCGAGTSQGIVKEQVTCAFSSGNRQDESANRRRLQKYPADKIASLPFCVVNLIQIVEAETNIQQDLEVAGVLPFHAATAMPRINAHPGETTAVKKPSSSVSEPHSKYGLDACRQYEPAKNGHSSLEISSLKRLHSSLTLRQQFCTASIRFKKVENNQDHRICPRLAAHSANPHAFDLDREFWGHWDTVTRLYQNVSSSRRHQKNRHHFRGSESMAALSSG